MGGFSIISEIQCEIFVPDFNLQGETFPFYILWKDNIKRISISHGEGVKLVALYNSVPQEVKLEKNAVEILKTEINGYLGGVFMGIFEDKSPQRIEVINFRMEFENNSFQDSKSILLFKPLIKVDDPPKEITLSFKKGNDKNTETVIPSSMVNIENAGSGTALLTVEVAEDSDVHVALPTEYEEFIANLNTDLKHSIQILIKKYPEFDSLLNSYLTILENPVLTISDDEHQYKNIINELESLLDDNKKFRNDLISGITAAITKNISFITEITGFLKYLSSLRPNRVIILNSFTEAIIPKGTSKMILKVHVTDLSMNEYKPITIREIKMISEKETKIPLYSLLRFRRER